MTCTSAAEDVRETLNEVEVVDATSNEVEVVDEVCAAFAPVESVVAAAFGGRSRLTPRPRGDSGVAAGEDTAGSDDIESTRLREKTR